MKNDEDKLETLLSFVEERLKRKHKPDPELVKKHNADPLNKNWQIPECALWEQSDLVHDLLAYLAERMTEMNKQKQTEIKSFLDWLEQEVGAKIDDLSNKTKIQNYLGDYQKGKKHLSFEELMDILVKNRGRIGRSLSGGTFGARLQREYENSLEKLLPIKERLAKTDWLIDQIVYRLYGLTEEEVKIVERKQ